MRHDTTPESASAGKERGSINRLANPADAVWIGIVVVADNIVHAPPQERHHLYARPHESILTRLKRAAQSVQRRTALPCVTGSCTAVEVQAPTRLASVSLPLSRVYSFG